MSYPQATRAHSLGLSVGATNLAGTRDGQIAAIRPSEVTLHGQRLTGFVDRVGDPVPLIAPDGSQHRPEHLLAEALTAMAHVVSQGAPVADMAITVPAHWPATTVDALRRNMGDRLPLVSDASAALTALRANPGLPTNGVIVLCDFGGSGTSITLADAASNFAPIGQTVRFPDFSGDQLDQALLTHVVAGLFDASHADPSGTAMVGSLARLRAECRAAKERLSAETATSVAVDLPGHRAEIRVTRTELEDLIKAPFTDFLAALDHTLERSGVAAAHVSAVATVGGGARIPLVTQRLSEHLRAPVVTTRHPQLTAAEGAALVAQRNRVAETPTAMTPASTAAAATSAIGAGEPSSAVGALAWSEDDHIDADLVYDAPRPEVHFQQEEWEQPEPPPRRTPIVLFGLSAAAAVIAATVFGVTLLSSEGTTPVEAATTVAPSSAPAAPVLSPAPPAPQAPEVTTVVAQKPVQRANPAPQQQRPVTQQPPVAPATTTPTTTTPTTTPPTTTPPTTPPTVPPIDPGPGDGGGTTTPPIDPGDGAGGTGTGTPPIDPGDGAGGTGTTTPPIDPGDGAGTPGA
ncbi:MAG TPA: Hsp70 family protein [Mycobacterium sp.]|nr:Hsp70 family protein [Mycobacterium sp.]